VVHVPSYENYLFLELYQKFSNLSRELNDTDYLPKTNVSKGKYRTFSCKFILISATRLSFAALVVPRGLHH
jgi:hypothetical protein